MHPQMPNQYLQNDFGILPSPHLQSHSPASHSGQAIPYASCDPNYSQDPYGYDLSKPVPQFSYMPMQLPMTGQQTQQFQQDPSASPMHNYSIPMYPQPMYQSLDLKRAQPSGCLTNDDPLATPSGNAIARRSAVKGPKFDRTYSDALEDELFDESSSTSQSVNSRSQGSRHATPNFAFPHINQYPHLYSLGHNGQVKPVQQQQQTNQSNLDKPVPTEMIYSQPNPNYHPLNRRLSSTAQLAERLRHLAVPNRMTVSPREAFLDYPDNADFRERTLFSKSASPNSHGSGDHASQYQDTEGTQSNDEEGEESNGVVQSISLGSYPQPPHELRSRQAPLTVPSRSASASTPRSAVASAEETLESSNNSSDSEYNPSAARRGSRSGGRQQQMKTFPCPDCGKRFDKSQSLQMHRRNSHGKTSGSGLSGQRFGNNSHRCDYVDPITGKVCNTVFSRPYDLVRHHETKHSAKRPEFICPHCIERKSFSRGDALQRHLRVKHSGVGRK